MHDSLEKIEPSPHEDELDDIESYDVKNPETMEQAAELVKEINAESEHIIDDAVKQLDAWSKKTGLDFALQRAKLEQKRKDLRFNRHLDTVDLFNLMTAGASVERAYSRLSGNSKELYQQFLDSLPSTSFDGSQEAVIEIADQAVLFQNNMGKDLPKDLTAFFKKFYTIFQEGRAKIAKKPEKQVGDKIDMDPESLQNFLRYI